MRLLSWVAERGPCLFISIDQETHDSLPAPCRKKSRIIYNPVFMREVSSLEIEAKRRSWGIPPNAVVVGQVASLHKEKGIWTILDLAKQLCAVDPQLYFVLVGDPSPALGEGPDLLAAIKNAGLEERVRLVGYESDVAAAYAALDIALCLFGEHLGAVGRAAYEAPLAGKPLIATLPFPDRSPSLIQNKTGVGFDPADLQGVGAAILEFAQNPDKRRAFGEMARETISERHNPSHHAAQIVEVYRDLLKTH